MARFFLWRREGEEECRLFSEEDGISPHSEQLDVLAKPGDLFSSAGEMNHRPWLWLLWLSLTVVAAFLRLNALGDRPMHADEATGARIASRVIAEGPYVFNPRHFHGPWLSQSTWPIARIRGEDSWSSLTAPTLRFGPALSGILLVLTPLLWIRRLGVAPALVTASLLATSPLLVFYSRMYIHEAWLAFFGMLAIFAVDRLIHRPTLQAGALLGLCLGLMFATKQTFVISVFSWTLASMGLLWWSFRKPPQCAVLRVQAAGYTRPLLLLSAIFLAITALAYTHGFQSPRGFIDAFLSFSQYEPTPGHGKPMGYYLHLLLWPKHVLGFWWTEGGVALLALAALALAWAREDSSSVVAFVAISGVVHLLVYSLIGYKTPWLMMLPWVHCCVVAGAAFSAFEGRSLRMKTGLLLGLVCLLGYQTSQSLGVSGRFANDGRNPYSYGPTTRDAERLGRWLEELAQMPTIDESGPVAVVGRDYWPLPWYLRKFAQIGYWPSVSTLPRGLGIVIAMPAEEAACTRLLGATHQRFPRSLRSNLPITLYLRNDLWAQWIEPPSE